MKKPADIIRFELGVYLLLAIAVFLLSARYDVFEQVNEFVLNYDHHELDEVIITLLFLLLCFLHFSIRRWKESCEARTRLEKANHELRQAMAEIRQLKGIIPICSNCKKVRNDQGYWQQVEQYVSDHSDALFSHGLCPECLDKAMTELDQDLKQEPTSEGAPPHQPG